MVRLNKMVQELRWTRSSYTLLSGFFLILVLIVIVWWPLVVDYASTYDPQVSLWRQLDWLLLGIFAVMSLLIIAGADLKADAWIVAVDLVGGLTIESWGTQTRIWTYFTLERPPLWIVPVWPIASLAIERLVRLLHILIPPIKPGILRGLYWLIFLSFFALMLAFVRHTLYKPFTWMALLTVSLFLLSPGTGGWRCCGLLPAPGWVIFWKYREPPANAGLITRARRCPFLPYWLTDWRLLLSGEEGSC